MNIICFKCPVDILIKFIDKSNNIVLILDAWDRNNMNYPQDVLNQVYKIYNVNNLDSIEELSSVYIDLESDEKKFDKAVSGAEYGILSSGYFNSILKKDLSYLNLAIATRDKREMKKKFEESGLRYAKNKSSYSLCEFNKGIKHGLDYPLVAKPAYGTGSFNTEILKNENELMNYFNSLSIHPAIYSQQITLEEFIDGDEYHIDSIWQNGECKFSLISKYMVPRISVMQNQDKNGSFILKEEENPQLYFDVRKQQNKLANAFNLQNCVTHIEFFIKDGEIYFSEIATRFAGGYTTEGIYHYLGIDLVEEWINVELEKEVIIDVKNSDAIGGWLNFSPLKKSGLVEYVPKEEDFLSLSWVNAVKIFIKKGDNYSHDNPCVWSVFLALEAKNEKDFFEKVKETYNLLPIIINY